MIKYHFSEKIILGDRILLIDVEPPYEMLYDLSSGFLQTEQGTRDVIENIQKVINGQLEMYSFGGSDYCIIDVYKEHSKIFYDFGDSEAKVSTKELFQLLEDWKSYLILHRNSA